MKTVIVISNPNIIPTHFKLIIFKAEVYLLSVSVSDSSTLATFIRGLFEKKLCIIFFLLDKHHIKTVVLIVLLGPKLDFQSLNIKIHYICFNVY